MYELLILDVTGAEPLTVAAAKDYLRVDDPAEGAQLAVFCAAAREKAENETSRILRPQAICRLTTKLEERDSEPHRHRFSSSHTYVTLPRGPLLRGDDGSISGLAVTVEGVALTSDQYEVSEGESVLPAIRLRGCHGRKVVIDFQVGTPGSDVPASVSLAMLWMVGFWYQNRDAEDQEGLLAQIPGAALNLLKTKELMGEWV